MEFLRLSEEQEGLNIELGLTLRWLIGKDVGAGKDSFLKVSLDKIP